MKYLLTHSNILIIEKNARNVNFGKAQKRKVTFFNGDSATKSVEIIGQKGKYSVSTDGSSKALADLKGKTGTLREVKTPVSTVNKTNNR